MTAHLLSLCENTHVQSKSHSVISDSLWPHGLYPVHGILQATILKCVAFPFFKGSSQPRDQTRSPSLQADSLPTEPQGKPRNTGVDSLSVSSGSFPPRNRTRVSCITDRFFNNLAIREAHLCWVFLYFHLIGDLWDKNNWIDKVKVWPQNWLSPRALYLPSCALKSGCQVIMVWWLEMHKG